MESISPTDLGPIVSNEFGDRYLFSINRYTFRQTDAHTLYKKQYGDGIFQENTLHILVGMDSGLLLQYLHRIGISPTSRYVIVELPKTLERLRQEGLLDESHERVACVTVDELPAIAKKFEFANYLYTEKINIWKSFAALDAFLPEYAELHFAARDFIEAFAWQIKVQLGNEIFIRRQLENLSENRHSAACLKNLFPGKTAVLLAGGPSLDDILPWVRENRQNLVVLAVSRIARRLKEVDLTPDIFFSVDPQEVSFDVSKEMLYFGEKTLFVNSYHVVPKLLSQWQGRSVYVGPRWPWPEEGEEPCLDTPGPTVTHTAFAIAAEMGFSQIVLGGVDLCFSPTGHSHALGSHERQAGPQFNGFTTQVATNRGAKAFTTRAMAEGIAVFGDLAASAKKTDLRTINPTPNAAIIPWVEHRTLTGLTLESMTKPAWVHIQSALPPEDGSTRTGHYHKILAKLNTAEKHIRSIRKMAREALKCNDGLFGRNGLQPNFKFKNKMDKIEKTLSLPPLAKYSQVLKQAGLRYFVKIARPDTEQEWSDSQIEETGRLYYQAYLDSSNTLLEILDEAKQRVSLRMAEEDPATDPNRLFDGWEKHGETGRIILWQHRRPQLAGTESPHITPPVHTVERAFLAILAARPESLAKAVDASAGSNLARQRVLSLFRDRETELLAELLPGLAESGQPGMPLVHHLAAGYLAELQEDYALALDEYQQAIGDESSPTTEDALRRIASVSLHLDDPANALLALECLSKLTPEYLPRYAELAQLLGQTQTALETYADYLDYFPNDPVVLLKVAKLYQQAGEKDFAANILGHILQQDPNNQTARTLLDTLQAAALP